MFSYTPFIYSIQRYVSKLEEIVTNIFLLIFTESLKVKFVRKLKDVILFCFYHTTPHRLLFQMAYELSVYL